MSISSLRVWLAVGFIAAIAVLSGPASPAMASEPGPGVLSVRPSTLSCNAVCTLTVVVTLTNQGRTKPIQADEPTIQTTQGEAQGEIAGPPPSPMIIDAKNNLQWKVDLTASRLPATISISVRYFVFGIRVTSDSQADLYLTPEASSGASWPEIWGGEIGAAVALLAVVLGYFYARRADLISWRRDAKHKTYASLFAWIQEFRNTAKSDFDNVLVASGAKSARIRELGTEKRAELDLLKASTSVLTQFEVAHQKMADLDKVLEAHRVNAGKLGKRLPETDEDSLWTNYDGGFTEIVNNFLQATKDDLEKEHRSLWRRQKAIASGQTPSA